MNKATGADIVFGEYLFNGFVRLHIFAVLPFFAVGHPVEDKKDHRLIVIIFLI